MQSYLRISLIPQIILGTVDAHRNRMQKMFLCFSHPAFGHKVRGGVMVKVNKNIHIGELVRALHFLHQTYSQFNVSDVHVIKPEFRFALGSGDYRYDELLHVLYH